MAFETLNQKNHKILFYVLIGLAILAVVLLIVLEISVLKNGGLPFNPKKAEPTPEITEEPTPVQKMGYRELLRLVAALPADARTVFNMYVVEGYSHKEIAKELGCNEATSRSKLQRARLRLQEMIKGKV